MVDPLIPDGYSVELTDEKVKGGLICHRFFRWRAKQYLRQHPPKVPSYHLRVEKVGFVRYAIVAYQNRLVEVEETPAPTRPPGLRPREYPRGKW